MSDGSVIIDTKIDSSQYKKALGDMKSSTDAWAKNTSADFKAVQKSSLGLGTAIAGMSTAFVALSLANFVKEAFTAASQYNALGVALYQVGKNAGYSAAEVDKQVNTLRRMGIAGSEARQTMTQLVQSQVDIAKSSQLARVAQDAAVISATNTSEAFEHLVSAIKSGRAGTLSTIGINVNFEQSYQRMAGSLGKATESLTEQEKTQARVNAVLSEGEKISGAYANATDDVKNKTNSLLTTHREFFTDVGKLVVGFDQVLGIASKYSKILEGLSGIALAARGIMAGMSFDEIVDGANSLQEQRERVEGFTSALAELAKLEAQIAAAGAQGIINPAAYQQDISALRDALKGPREEIERLEEVIKALEHEGIDTTAQRIELDELRDKLSKMPAVVGTVRNAINEMSNGLRSFTETARNVPNLEDLFADAAASSNKAALAFEKVRGLPKTWEDAIKYVEQLTKDTKEGKTAAEELARAKLEESIRILSSSAAADENTAGMLRNKAATEDAAQAALTLAAAKEAEARATANWGKANEAASILMSGKSLTEKPKKSGTPVADIIKDVTDRIKELNTVNPDSFTAKLAAGLADIDDKFAKSSISPQKLRQLKDDFTKAFSGNYTREMEQQLAELDNSGSARLQNLRREADEFAKALQNSGKSAEEAKAKAEAFYNAGARKVDLTNLQERVRFTKELRDAGILAGIGLEDQNRLIQMQAEDFRAAFPDLAQYVDKWAEFQMLQSDTSAEAGFKRSADAFVKEWTDAGKVAEKQFDVMIGAIQGLGTAAVDAIFGDAEFRADQFFKDIAKQLLNIAMNQMIAGLLGGIFGGSSGGGFLGGLFGSKHTGGIAGVPDTNASRRVSPAAFAYAPRFHSGGVAGLRNSEIPAILQRGEGIFTQAQMKALSPVGAGGNYVYSPNIEINYSGSASSTPEMDMQKIGEQLNSQLRKGFESMIDQRLITHSRPGGLLNKGIH